MALHTRTPSIPPSTGATNTTSLPSKTRTGHLPPRPSRPARRTTTQTQLTQQAAPPPSPSKCSSRPPASQSHAPASNPDKATNTLIRRILLPVHPSSTTTQPLSTLLPPLTSSDTLDFELYALIAVILRDFVYTWYSRITPDTGFGEEVLGIVAHCSRAVEGRVRDVERGGEGGWGGVVLDGVCGVLRGHIRGTFFILLGAHF